MRRRRCIQLALGIGGAAGLWLLTSPAAYADNCSSIMDCFYTTDAATMAAVALAVLIGLTLSLGAIAAGPDKPPPKTKEEAGSTDGQGRGWLPGFVVGTWNNITTFVGGVIIARVVGALTGIAAGPWAAGALIIGGLGLSIKQGYDAYQSYKAAKDDYTAGIEQANMVASAVFGVLSIWGVLRGLSTRLGSWLGIVERPPTVTPGSEAAAPVTPENPLAPTTPPEPPAPLQEPQGKGFSNQTLLEEHFKKHNEEFAPPFATQEAYEQAGNKFMSDKPLAGVLQKVRPNGDIVRYNPSTEEFGILRKDGILRTYFIPDPAKHGYPTNLDYFLAQ
jgi:hypothetical protein